MSRINQDGLEGNYQSEEMVNVHRPLAQGQAGGAKLPMRWILGRSEVSFVYSYINMANHSRLVHQNTNIGRRISTQRL